MKLRFESIIVSITAITAMALLVLTQNNILAKYECELRNGKWFDSSQFCSYPKNDIGQRCYQDSDCSRKCIYESSNPNGTLTGRCSRSINVCGRQTIPFRTSDRNDLRFNDCSDKTDYTVPDPETDENYSERYLQPLE